MAGTRPFLGTEISLDEIDYTVSTECITSEVDGLLRSKSDP